MTYSRAFVADMHAHYQDLVEIARSSGRADGTARGFLWGTVVFYCVDAFGHAMGWQ